MFSTSGMGGERLWVADFLRQPVGLLNIEQLQGWVLLINIAGSHCSSKSSWVPHGNHVKIGIESHLRWGILGKSIYHVFEGDRHASIKRGFRYP